MTTYRALVVVTFGLTATGLALVVSAILVRVFANEQSDTVKLVLLGIGSVVGAGVLGLLCEPPVTPALDRLSRE